MAGVPRLTAAVLVVAGIGQLLRGQVLLAVVLIAVGPGGLSIVRCSRTR